MKTIDKAYIEKLFELWGEQNLAKEYSLNFIGEDSEFFRLNDSSLRQATFINQAELLIIKNEGKSEKNVSIQLTGDETIDCKNINQIFSLYFGLNLNLKVKESGHKRSKDEDSSTLSKSEMPSVLEEIKSNSKIVGLLTTGKIFSAHIGAEDKKFNWFEVDRTDVDYSIFSEQASIKFYSSEYMDRSKQSND